MMSKRRFSIEDVWLAIVLVAVVSFAIGRWSAPSLFDQSVAAFEQNLREFSGR